MLQHHKKPSCPRHYYLNSQPHHRKPSGSVSHGIRELIMTTKLYVKFFQKPTQFCGIHLPLGHLNSLTKQVLFLQLASSDPSKQSLSPSHSFRFRNSWDKRRVNNDKICKVFHKPTQTFGMQRSLDLHWNSVTGQVRAGQFISSFPDGQSTLLSHLFYRYGNRF